MAPPAPRGAPRCLVARPLPGVLEVGGGSAIRVAAEAPPRLWFVGSASSEALVLVGAADFAAAAEAPWFLRAALPEGLEVVGVFVSDEGAENGSAPPVLPSGLPPELRAGLRLLAARAADGALAAWRLDAGAAGAPLGPWALDDRPSGWYQARVRARLGLRLCASSGPAAREQLAAIAGSLPGRVRFRFPGAEVIASLQELSSMKQPPSLPAVGKEAESAVISVEALCESLSAGGRSNFLEFDARPALAFDLDFAAYLPPRGASESSTASDAVEVASALLAAAGRQLRALMAHVGAGAEAAGAGLNFRCFAPTGLGHLVCCPGTEDRAMRERLHRLFRLPQAPVLLPACALPWAAEAHPQGTGKLVSPHAGCGDQPGWWKGDAATTRAAFVRGAYEYCHYMQDTDDNGWGCAYRCLQTCVSWYRMQFYTSKDVPSISDIQSCLKRIDHSHKDIVVGGKKWIGTMEGMYMLQDYLALECNVLFCPDIADMASKVPQMLQHFEAEGTPIMMGAGEYAYTLVGLCFDSGTGAATFLIVDPHYTGADNLKTILQKGWVGWKDLDFFEKATRGGNKFINCVLPVVPKGPDSL